MGCVVSNDALTNEEFWDESWKFRQKKNTRILKDWNPYWGKNGLFMKLFRRHGGDASGKAVLELGGGGANMRLLSLSKYGGAKVTAIDFSPVAQEDVKTLFDANHQDINVLAGDFYAHDYNNQTFDYVIHWGVMEHFTDLEKFFALNRRVVSDNGMLFFAVPNMETVIGARAWKHYNPENWAAHIHHPTEDVEAALEANGLRLEKEFYYGTPSFCVEQMEKGGLAKKVLNKIQWASRRSCAVFPFYHRIGHKSVSTLRAFIARPI